MTARAAPAKRPDKSGPRRFTRVTAAELEEWQRRAADMKLIELSVAIQEWRPRAMRVESAGADKPPAIWLELHGPDGWARVGDRLVAP